MHKLQNPTGERRETITALCINSISLFPARVSRYLLLLSLLLPSRHYSETQYIFFLIRCLWDLTLERLAVKCV